MRDILDDLVERLQDLRDRAQARYETYSAEKRRIEADYQQFLGEMTVERESLERLIQIEASRAGVRVPEPAQAKSLPPPPLGDFILLTLQERSPLSKDDFRDECEDKGYLVNGRALHTTLLNLVRQGRVQEHEGLYSLPLGNEDQDQLLDHAMRDDPNRKDYE